MRRAVLTLILAVPLLVACQLSLPGRDRSVPEPTPVTAGTITTTTLDAAPTTPSTTPDSAEQPTAAVTTAEAETGADTEAAAAAAPEVEPAGAEATATGTPDPEPPPQISKSPSQIACEEDGGSWARAGSGGGMACVRPTRDGGKQCRSKTDCEGECLARSRTCAPIQPLFGCNAVLMDNGAEVNLCID